MAGLCTGVGSGVAYAQASDAYYNFLLGRHLEGEGNSAEGLKALERAAAGDPKSAEVRAEIAAMFYRDNQPQQAEQAAKAALSLDSNNFEANRILGSVYAQASANERAGSPTRVARAREALPYLERAVGMSPLDANLNYQLGLMYVEIGETPKAVQAFTRVVEQSPYSSRARLSLAQAQAATKNLRGAIETLSEIADEEPSVLFALGGYQQEAGLLSEAVATFTKALESRPTDRRLKAARIQALYAAKEYQQAAKAASDAQRQHPEDSFFARLHAAALSRSGESVRAIEILETTVRAFPKDPNIPNIQLELAGYYSDVGREGDAEKLLRQLLETNPSNPNILNHLGYMLARNGKNLDEAIGLVNRALKVEPDNGAYLDSLGWAYFKRGDLREAEKYLGAAAAQLPENAEVLDHLGDLYARQGRWDNAIDAWNRALKGDTDNVDPKIVQKKIDDARSKASGSK
jgi:tetratricopeptide (TPR) repeat protein